MPRSTGSFEVEALMGLEPPWRRSGWPRSGLISACMVAAGSGAAMVPAACTSAAMSARRIASGRFGAPTAPWVPEVPAADRRSEDGCGYQAGTAGGGEGEDEKTYGLRGDASNERPGDADTGEQADAGPEKQ
jgi:hypothetical protein